MGERHFSPVVRRVQAKGLDKGRRVVKAILTTDDFDLENDRVEPTGGVWRDNPFVNWEHGVPIGTGEVETIRRKGKLYPLGTSTLFAKAADLRGADLTKYDDRFRPVGKWEPDLCLEVADDAYRLIDMDIATGVSIEFLPIESTPNGKVVSATNDHPPTDFHKWEGLGWAHTVRPINPGAQTIIIDKAIKIAETGRLPGGKPLCAVVRKAFEPFRNIPRPASVRVEKAMDELEDDISVVPEADGEADGDTPGEPAMKATPAAFATVVQMYKDASKMLRDLIAGPSVEHEGGVARLTQEADDLDDRAAQLLADGRALFDDGGGLDAPDGTPDDEADMPMADDGEFMAKGLKKGAVPRFLSRAKLSELEAVQPDADARMVQVKAKLAEQQRQIRRLKLDARLTRTR